MTTTLDSLPRIGAPATRALNAAGYSSLRQLARVPRSELAQLARLGWVELDSSPYLQIWLLSWHAGTGTGWHDHGESAGAFLNSAFGLCLGCELFLLGRRLAHQN